MAKIKKIVAFLAVLSLPFEISLFSLLGKEIKIWMVLTVILGLFLIKDFRKNGFGDFFKLKTVWLGLALVVFSLLALVNSPLPSYSFQQVIVLTSLIIFAVFFEKHSSALGKEIYSGLFWGMAASSLVAILQNLAFDRGLPNFEVMPARPNSFFPEPDWLGFYLALGLVLFLVQGKNKSFPSFLKNKIVLVSFVLLSITALVITVARASWLALLAEMSAIVLASAFLAYKKSGLKASLGRKVFVGSYFLALIAVSIAFVSLFQLTRFNLFDRARSIFFKEHIITLAINPNTQEKIKINLEEIDLYKGRGYIVEEEYVEDENVESREEKASSTFGIIKESPLWGSGLGITMIRTDFLHNANNLFLEWWASGGIGAFVAIAVSLVYLITRGIKIVVKRPASAQILIAGTLGFVVLNLFNASIFLAFAWFFLGYLFSLTREKIS